MHHTDPGFWLLPSQGRATTNLPRFFDACRKTGLLTNGYVVVDDADYATNHEAYDALDLPQGWTVHLVRGGSCGEATEQALAELLEDDTQWVGWLADDLLPVTPGWDAEVVEALTPWNCVSTDDGHDAPVKFNGATAFGGDLVRALGGLYPPGCKHFYIDTRFEELSKVMGIWQCRMDILVKHMHASYTAGTTPDETTAFTTKFWANDESAFLRWKNNGGLLADANKIGALLVEYGVSEALPTLDGVRLMVATPCGDGTYERLFVQGLFGTIECIRQCGGQVTFAEAPYISDIVLARTKIIGMFLRSDATHMLLVDSDQGWRPQDVARLLSFKRDFVGVAGVRKVSPPSFAVRMSDERGRPTPIRQEATTGLIEASHVGMAFVIITRACAQRVVAAHPELMFTGSDGKEEHAVFMPMVVNRSYLSEDYAFCHRWRALGGKIHVDPMISLQHVGAHVWSGAWIEQLNQIAAEQKTAA